ncbi:MAG: sigma-70 family RNA polymerase sigma factor [Alphaproteobacteria bacterium]
MSTESKRQAVTAELPRIRRYAIALMRDSVEADDPVNVVVVRALDKLHLWSEGANMRTWLFTIMHNLYATEMRRRSRALDSVPLDAAPPRAEPAGQEAAVDWSELSNAMSGLSVVRRQVILLVGLEGMTYAEAAGVLEVPVGTVMSRLSHAREGLRRRIDEGSQVSTIRRIK